jgi:hypothetical protein
MATLSVSLNIESINVLSANLSLSVSKDMDIDSGSLARAKVKGTAADTNDLLVYKANEKNDRAYLYIKNLDAELENYIYLRNETEGNVPSGKIGGGEFAFIPLAPDKDYEVIATKVDTLIEYGIFGNDNSAVTGKG